MDTSPSPAPSPEPVADLTLTFAIEPKDLVRLRRLPLFAGVAVVQRRVATVYYDTSDLALKRQSQALRIRREGGRYIEALEHINGRTVGSGGLTVFEAAVARAVPDLTLPGMFASLDAIDGRRLRPIFSSQVRRGIRSLQSAPDTVVEVAIDQGALTSSGGAQMPICEISVKLGAGDPAALFEIGRTLARAVPLRIEPRSIAVRGYALVAEADAGGKPPPTLRYGRVELARDMPVEDALASIVRRCLAHLLANDRVTRQGDPEGVHQMRVALRRLRVAFSLFKSLIPEDQRHWVGREVKWLTDSLGAARDWDIFADLIAPVQKAFPGETDLKMLADQIGGQQREAYGALTTALVSHRCVVFALDLLAWVELRAWRQQEVSETSVLLLSPLGELADRLLEKRFRTARKLGRGFNDLAPEGRHRLRIALKKMRYAADSFERIYDGKAVGRYVSRLQDLQDDLGLLNDIATAERLADVLPQGDERLRRAGALIRGWYGHIASDKNPKLGKELDRFLKASPFWKRPEKVKMP